MSPQLNTGETAGTRLHPWLEILRVPNLTTVPGDPLAGAFFGCALADTRVAPLRVLCVAGAALALYAAGLMLNDLCDLTVDRVHRPERPLPRGALHPQAVRTAIAGLFALAALLGALAGRSPFIHVLVLAGLIWMYDARLKSSPRNAAVAMGLCRGTSVLLGGSLAGNPPGVILVAAVLAAYIGVVTWIASREHTVATAGREAWAPAILLGAGALLGLVVRLLAGGLTTLGTVIALIAMAVAIIPPLQWGKRLAGNAVPPVVTQKAIGAFIRSILPWQAVLLALAASPAAIILSVLLLACIPVNRALSLWFNPT